jgi:hypothetical protein
VVSSPYFAQSPLPRWLSKSTWTRWPTLAGDLEAADPKASLATTLCPNRSKATKLLNRVVAAERRYTGLIARAELAFEVDLCQTHCCFSPLETGKHFGYLLLVLLIDLDTDYSLDHRLLWRPNARIEAKLSCFCPSRRSYQALGSSPADRLRDNITRIVVIFDVGCY